MRLLGVNSVRDSKSLNQGKGDFWSPSGDSHGSHRKPASHHPYLHPNAWPSDGSQIFFFNEKKKWIKITLENVRKEQKNVNKGQNIVALTCCF